MLSIYIYLVNVHLVSISETTPVSLHAGRLLRNSHLQNKQTTALSANPGGAKIPEFFGGSNVKTLTLTY